MRALVLAVAVLFGALAHARPMLSGHVVGNGGGVICFNGVCQTLVEAGLRLSPEYNGVWIPDATHFSTVKANIQNHAFLATGVQDQLFLRIFGNVDHFRRVEVIDPAKLDAIKRAYLQVAKDAGFPFDPATFEVVAFSSDDTASPAMTYLLPQFFKLDLERQASILIHEGLYRGRPSKDLKYVLQFESSMAVVSTAVQNDAVAVIKPRVDQQLIAYRFGLIDKAQLIGGILSLASSTNPSSKFLLPGSVLLVGDSNRWNVDHIKLLELASVEPRIPYMFSKIQSIELAGGCRSSGSPSGYSDWSGSNDFEINTEYCSYALTILKPDALDLVLPD